VEKIRRDVRITTIYEGTSEIMQWTVSRDRCACTCRTRQYYKKIAASLEALHARTRRWGLMRGLAVNVVQETTERCRLVV